MNLRETILEEHSKKQCNKIVQWVGSSQDRFNELYKLFLDDVTLVTQRASWPVSECVIAHPNFIRNHFKSLLKNLEKKNLHDAIKRHSIRLLQFVPIPEKYHGLVMEKCFDYVSSPTEAVGIKAFSLTVLGNLAKKYPEIKMLIEDQLPYQTAAFRSRAKNLLKST